MQRFDGLKAAGAGLLLLILNLLLTTAVIYAWAAAVEPGQTQAYYNALALRIAAWSAPIGGALLFLLAGWLFARRRPQRNGLLFIGAVWVAYIVIDAGSGLLMGGAEALLTPVFAIHAALSLAAGLAGAWLGRTRA